MVAVIIINDKCTVGNGACYSGLTCLDKYCTLKEDDQDGAVTSLVTKSSSTINTTKGGPSFVLVVVGLLGAAMLALAVVLQRRHRVLLRHHQYSEVDATATRVLIFMFDGQANI